MHEKFVFKNGTRYIFQSRTEDNGVAVKESEIYDNRDNIFFKLAFFKEKMLILKEILKNVSTFDRFKEGIKTS